MRAVTEQVVYRTKEMQRVEARYGQSLGDLLRSMYVERGMLQSEIGAELGITNSAVSRWLAAFGIEARRGGPVREAIA